jgi:hypothetical protein
MSQLEKDDGQWVRATKDYANTRYSTLDQINTANVGSLKVAWTFDTGVARGQEAAPIVANNTMYVVEGVPPRLFNKASSRSCCVFAFAEAEVSNCCTEVCSPASPKVLNAFSKFRSAPIVSSRYWLIFS